MHHYYYNNLVLFYPCSLSIDQLTALLTKNSDLASARGKYGSAAYYSADRDGDYDFIRTILRTGLVPIEHVNEAIARSSSNGLLSVLRVFVEHGGIKAITHNAAQVKDILANCDNGIPNGPCWRYLTYA